MIIALIIVLGLIFGSFLNAVIFRLKRNEQFISGRSKCLKCKHALAFADLIPLFSFIFLRAKCRYCKAKISWQYPAVELVTALVFLIGYWHYLSLTDYLVYLVFSCWLIVIFVYDFKYYLILDKVSLSALVTAFVLNFLSGKSALNLLIGALVVSGFFLLQFVVSKGKWIGGGDLRLGLVMGAMLGWPMALVALALAYLSGAALGLLLIVFKKKSFNSQLPFGTFLTVSTWAVLLWGEQILNWYLNSML
jgi:prepilin signal peptidase PulO-like enzyme (type II secretory pathway)